jgi:hypothetical protein
MDPAAIFHWDPPQALLAPGAQKKLFTRLSHTCKAFGVRSLCLVDAGGVIPGHFGDAELALAVVDDLEEALLLYSYASPVFVERGGADLFEFVHPRSPVYVFGSDYGALPRADVSIETDIPIYAEVAAGIVLADRRAKGCR